MISKETADRLHETAKAFAQADERLRATHEVTSQTNFRQEAATDYLSKRREHQDAIAAAEKEAEAEA